jgi:hypothetical protein
MPISYSGFDAANDNAGFADQHGSRMGDAVFLGAFFVCRIEQAKLANDFAFRVREQRELNVLFFGEAF